MKRYNKLQILLIAMVLLATLSLSAQKTRKYTLTIKSDSQTISHKGLLTQLQDSSITIGTSYEKVNKLLMIESYEEVDVLQIESLSFDKMGNQGVSIGVISGLVIGTTLGILFEEETGIHCGFGIGCGSNKAGKVLGDAALGMLGGGILGYLFNESYNKPDVFKINKNHKDYMDKKEYLEKYVFKY